MPQNQPHVLKLAVVAQGKRMLHDKRICSLITVNIHAVDEADTGIR